MTLLRKRESVCVYTGEREHQHLTGSKPEAAVRPRTKQGCPLPLLRFNTVLEAFTNVVRQEETKIQTMEKEK